MGEGTHDAVFALAQLVGVERAELRLVLFRVVEVFDCVVRFGTVVPQGTLLRRLAHRRRVPAQRPPPVA